MKFAQEPYVITKAYEMTVRERAAIFRDESQTRKSFIFTFITPFGVAHNSHYGLVQNDITAEDLFV